jgi:hypothetical protein
MFGATFGFAFASDDWANSFTRRTFAGDNAVPDWPAFGTVGPRTAKTQTAR